MSWQIDNDFQELQDTTLKVPTVKNYIVRKVFWNWYAKNENIVLVRKRFLFIKVVIRTKDLKFLFVLLFGQQIALDSSK